LNVRNSTTSAILRCSVHFTIYMHLYLYSYRRETARQLRMYAQLTRCFSAVAELLVLTLMCYRIFSPLDLYATFTALSFNSKFNTILQYCCLAC